ncbi:MAG: hypothetical protein JJD98_01620 [Polaromonas sp.]|nr:hypothetical protein [Polaromonas sp.]
MADIAAATDKRYSLWKDFHKQRKPTVTSTRYMAAQLRKLSCQTFLVAVLEVPGLTGLPVRFV